MIERYDLLEVVRQAYEQQVYQPHIAQELEIALGQWQNHPVRVPPTAE